ncbi:hypothetical protein KI809_18680 [Geobacter pelophilus]|uniref:Mu-like prophage FluMu N-terminal domain-containing protein n=1 Tax=Geoanaerobacter pelophilus TaxID=60036 RepID=A0AAW4LB65_9BACT|nr:hypothetical protein [Geoanaerobacter pelophilus]MBT0666338.1 hypothetical protein [Geoanaerobacter pelophilus]
MRVEVNPGYHVDTKLRKEPFFPGEQFDLDDKEANRLIGLQVVKAATGKTSLTDNGAPSSPQLNVAETVKLVMAAGSLTELQQFKNGEERKGVLDAIAKRESQIDEETAVILAAGIPDLETLEKCLINEKRSAVIAAIEQRRAELTPPE